MAGLAAATPVGVALFTPGIVGIFCALRIQQRLHTRLFAAATRAIGPAIPTRP